MHKLIKKFLIGGNYSFNYTLPTNLSYGKTTSLDYKLDKPTFKEFPGQSIYETPDYSKRWMKESNRILSNNGFLQTDLKDQLLTEAAQNGKWSKVTNMLGGVGNAFSSVYDVIPTSDKEINSTDSNIAQLRGKTALMLMQSGNPYAMAAGAAVGILDKTGAFGDASEGLGKSEDFWNGAASFLLPGVGWLAPKTDDYKMSDQLAQSSGYSGSRAFAEKALKNAGAKLFTNFFDSSRKKANDMILTAKDNDTAIQGVLSLALTDFARQNNMAEINGLRIQNITSGGNQMFRAAKHGMKMSPTKEQVEKARLVFAKKGNKVTLDPFASLEDFMKWLEDKGLTLNNDYDYVKLYGDKPLFEEWKNDTNPNKHFSDKYKKPNHITFSKESIYNSPETPGGTWYKDVNGKQHFKPSNWLKQQRSYETYKQYFDQNEPDVQLDWDETLKFQNGGQMNVIPDGALHARLHHMEDVNPDLKGQITKKGIPVVSEGDGGEIELQAEIERNELILAKDVTTSIEELWKKYETEHKDEYAIMAGLILAQLIMENTDDRTGLIQLVG